MNSVKDANSYLIALREDLENDTTHFLKVDFFEGDVPVEKIKEYYKFQQTNENCRVIMGSRSGSESEQFIFSMYEEIEEKTKGMEPNKQYDFAVDLETGDVDVTVLVKE